MKLRLVLRESLFQVVEQTESQRYSDPYAYSSRPGTQMGGLMMSHSYHGPAVGFGGVEFGPVGPSRPPSGMSVRGEGR